MKLDKKALINELRKYLHSKYKNIIIIYTEYDNSIEIQFTNLFLQNYFFKFYFGEFELTHMLNQLENNHPSDIIFMEIVCKIEDELNKRFKSLLYY